MHWQDFLTQEQSQSYFQQLMQFLKAETELGKTILPPTEDRYKALELTPWDKVKVVILGQDPYHGVEKGVPQAMGLAFAVNKGVSIPPSLRNIYKALEQDYADFQIPKHGDLTPWAKQGVLLLNTVLTVEQGKANSHSQKGWEIFTDSIIAKLSQERNNLVFLLWGANAKRKRNLIDESKHCVLVSVHPSPLSAHRGFFDCQHFVKTNQYLTQNNLKPINWSFE